MEKNGKYFVAPRKSSDNFKVLFGRLAAEGAGRPVDEKGFADGPWTPETLATAITCIDANEKGIDVRTVQTWFQDNDHGISSDNIRWLARVIGCDDPEATSFWQAEFSRAKERLTKARRQKKYAKVNGHHHALVKIAATSTPNPPADSEAQESKFRLSTWTEACFGSQASMTLPLAVFAAACMLGLISFTLGLHSIVFAPVDGVSKQVGFLWAPNWTITFLFVLPVYLALLIELLRCWKEQWRPKLVGTKPELRRKMSWERRLRRSDYAFWITLFATIGVASVFNWVATHLIPLATGDLGGWPVDWGRIAIVRPDVSSVESAVFFSGLVFIYNGVTAYFFFAAQVFMLLLRYDYSDLIKDLSPMDVKDNLQDIRQDGLALASGIYRCAALGIVITILMKLQSSFLHSRSQDIVAWLMRDLHSVFGSLPTSEQDGSLQGFAPGFFYSFFCVVAIAGTFLYATLSIRKGLTRLEAKGKVPPSRLPWTMMNAAMVLLILAYFSIGEVPGFTLLVVLALLFAVYVMCRSSNSWGSEQFVGGSNYG